MFQGAVAHTAKFTVANVYNLSDRSLSCSSYTLLKECRIFQVFTVLPPPMKIVRSECYDFLSQGILLTYAETIFAPIGYNINDIG